MRRLPVASGMFHRLTTDARAAGATYLHVAAIVEHAGRILLLARGGDGFLEATWQPPTALVLTDDTLFEALDRSLAHTRLTLDAITGYLGHYDNVVGHGEFVRVLPFAVAVSDPHGICRNPTVGHLWTRLDELPNNTMPPPHQLTGLLSSPIAALSGDESALATCLRAHARGLYPAEAAAELLVRHATWLCRNDFTTRFVHHGTNVITGTDTAAIDWPAAIAALDSGELPCSGGEGRVLRLAASLAEGIPVDLRDAVTGLDARNIEIFSKSVLHASGRRSSS
jgi:8-oxo-dGTP diphosphatase